MKTVCLKVNVSSAKTNILLDGAIIVKVVIFSVMQRDTRLFTQQDLVTITGLCLCIDHQKVLLIIFSRKESLVSICMTEKINFAIIAPSKRIVIFAELILHLKEHKLHCAKVG